ncbi:DMT family transporter [Arcobacter arenosus]|uniref:DMT family transporter n=1 Tax=Arcobacter arenosus TaxID=2576037 RepID=A0A5R8Y3Y5_9BACT|nr:DMT family transporter [Arcobacter arenosus]TLP40819.1 DMT family transporter [Arcobacter arenosus]
MLKDTRIQGMLIATLGVFIISFDALLIRLSNTDASVVTFYRGLFMGISMLLLWLIINKGKITFKIKPKEFLTFSVVTILSSIGTCLFVFSIKYTIAANTVVLLSTASFFAAIFSYIFLKEKIKKNTLIAIIISFLGIAIVFGSSSSFGSLGDLLGVLLAIAIGLELTLLRKYQHFSKVLIISLSGFLIAIIMYFSNDNIFDVSSENLQWLFLMGFIQIPLAMYLIFLSTKFITSAEVSLFSIIETVLAPVWLWLALGELVPKMTIIGGALVVIAIFINAMPNKKYN